MADLLLNIIGSDGASTPLRAVGAGFQELAKFALDCTKAFEEQAKADRLLERQAGALTPVFKAQAAAMQEQLGASDDMVQGIQTMLLRFGEAPDQVEATTRALLDYSAATGEDAVSATRHLLSSVESGKAAFKDLGLVYEKTGRASEDLGAITEALAGKVGGSAAAEADSLAGRARIAQAAVDEFKESIGGLASELISRTGVVSAFTEVIQALTETLTGDKAAKAEKHLLKLTEMRGNLGALADAVADSERNLQEVIASPSSGPTQIERASDELKGFRAQLAAAEADFARFAQHGDTAKALPGLKGADRLTRGGRAAASKGAEDEAKAAEEEAKDNLKAVEEWFAEEEAMAERHRVAMLEAADRAYQDVLKTMDRDNDLRLKNIRAREEAEEKAAETRLKLADKADKKLLEQNKHQNEKMVEEMTDAGTKAARAFGAAMATAMEAFAAGEELDGVALGMDVGSSIVQLAGEIVASFGGVAGIVGKAIQAGGQIGFGVGKAVHQGSKRRAGKHHDGGWIGDELGSYHSGGTAGLGSDEELAVLQRGEVVWSRQQVAGAGGPAAVDKLRRGGTTINLTIQAQDSKGVREFFEGPGGRGLFNARRTGAGDVVGLFGGR